MTTQEFKAMVLTRRLRSAREEWMQQDIQRALIGAPYVVKREYRINAKNRIDFAISADGEAPFLGIECKVKTTPLQAMRQLIRYARTGQFSKIILLTSKAVLLPMNEVIVDGKMIPVEVVQTATL